MAANAQLKDYPPVVSLQLYQDSTARPGRLIVETLITNNGEEFDNLPRFTELTLFARLFTGTWEDMRLVNPPRVSNGLMRMVFEDNRWRLKDTTLQDNFNDRASGGSLKTWNARTAAGLVTEISNATGVPMSTGAMPSFSPPARWTGKNAYEAFERFLKYTGCRCVYDPTTMMYNISEAGSGTIPTWTNRVFKPAPPSNIKQIKCYSAPILYEDELDCTAKQLSAATGNTEALAADSLETDPMAEHSHTNFRLWEADAVTHPAATALADVLFTGHRAKSELNDPERPTFQNARIKGDDWDMFPVHESLFTVGNDVVDVIETTSGGKVFVTEHPVLLRDSGTTLSKTAKLITSYYIKENDELKREEATVLIDSSAKDTITVQLPWIKPVDSTLGDIDNDFAGLTQTVANAIAKKYNQPASNVRLTSPVHLDGAGYVGAVHYQLDNRDRAKIYFFVAINYSPSGMGNIR